MGNTVSLLFHLKCGSHCAKAKRQTIMQDLYLDYVTIYAPTCAIEQMLLKIQFAIAFEKIIILNYIFFI